jgi:hypothetical protein
VLSGEWHPFSVATDETNNVITALISANGGDWTRQFADLANVDEGCNLGVDLYGPFAVGGGDWSLIDEPALLLVVGGTGIFGYLLALSDGNNVPAIHRNPVLHLVWCVKTMADYYALAARLPSQHNGVMITVYVTDGCSQMNIVGDSIVDNVTTVTSTAYRAGCQELVNDNDRQENYVDRHRLGVLASLTVALCSLSFMHWGWMGIRNGLLPVYPRSLMSYMMWWRLMPVVLALAAVIITTLLGGWVVNWMTRRSRGTENGLTIIKKEEEEAECMFKSAMIMTTRVMSVVGTFRLGGPTWQCSFGQLLRQQWIT